MLRPVSQCCKVNVLILSLLASVKEKNLCDYFSEKPEMSGNLTGIVRVNLVRENYILLTSHLGQHRHLLA